MLTIRAAQMEVFATRALRTFAAPLEAHIERSFPRESAWMGASGGRAWVDAAIARGRGLGFETQREVCHYLNVVMLLGSHFDDDPLLPWVRDALSDGGDAEPLDRARALGDRALAHHDRVAGPDDELLRAATERLPTLVEAVVGALDEASLGALLVRLQPEREPPTPSQVRAVLAEARAVASAHGLDEPRGVALVAALMALVGHGFVDDLRLPWAREALRASAGEGRWRALLAAAVAYLDDLTAPQGGA
jgi:hypothetical protein